MQTKNTAVQELMGKLAATGVKEVQLHEPALVMWDSSKTLAAMFKKAYFSDKVRDGKHELCTTVYTRSSVESRSVSVV